MKYYYATMTVFALLVTSFGIVFLVLTLQERGNLKGMNNELIETLITRNEGFKRVPYLDTKGNTTIGVGHELHMTLAEAQKHYQHPLTSEEVKVLLSEDVKTVETQARLIFGTSWVSFNDARQAVVIDMLFNLGFGTFSEFHDFIDAAKKGRWDAASKEILDSDAARELPTRYQRNAEVMKTGDAQYFQLR